MDKKAYFMDFEFNTEDATLFPRPETELLVEKAITLIKDRNPEGSPFFILDIGTGCGNIAISLTKYIPSSRITALDISEEAIRVARENARRYAVSDRIEFIKSDLFSGIKNRYRDHFDLLISNPPYVSLGDFRSLPEAVKDEPYIALYGGLDGLDFYRRIVNESHAYIKEGGFLLMEMGYDQAGAMKNILAEAESFDEIEIYKDYSSIDRIIKARRCESV